MAPPIHAIPAPITIDGAWTDWEAVPPAYEDPQGDGGPGQADFHRLWLADDPERFYARFEAGAEINLQQDNDLVLYLDTDNDSQTGLPVDGIGAELAWSFGQRQGSFYHPGGSQTIFHADIHFCSLPTHSATQFELCIARDAVPDGSHPLFSGSVTRVLLRDGTAGDQLPNTGESVSYVFDDGPAPPEDPLPIPRLDAQDLRLVTHNVLSDGPWSGGQGPRFGRQLAAVAPHIVNFQEIYEHTPSQTAQFVETWLPSGPGETWHAAGNHDCQTISRLPVLGTWPLDGNLAVLLDAGSWLESDLLIVNAHLPCCTNDAGRRQEIDRILAFLRDARQPGGQLQIDADTPILILGDLNLVGDGSQLHSLLTGDIIDEDTYGEDFAPDWDGSHLTSIFWRQTEKRMGYTWRSDGSSYWPGHLDFMIYTDSVFEPAHRFLLYTPEMSPDSLAYYGLESYDSLVSDHLLGTADFQAADSGSSADTSDIFRPAQLRLQPNPSRGMNTVLHWLMARPGNVQLEMFDAGGRLVAQPAGWQWRSVAEGPQRVELESMRGELSHAPSGFYVLRLKIRDAEGTRTQRIKWLLLR
ncbi:MAG: hypothetical protein GF355_05440 [Candidatus Eisenbacteria bacterium]|nr:hypothetical protein [Candidatus Eisenbacteria bacterium]